MNMRKEYWYNILNYEGYYKISNYGNVYSVRRNKCLKQASINGYKQVQLRVDCVRKCFYVHVLVALAFIGPKPEYYRNVNGKSVLVLYEVNHKDLDKGNNYYKNLIWVTSKDNKAHAILHGKHIYGAYGNLNPGAKLKSKHINKIRHLYRIGKYNQYELGELFGVTQSNISYIVNNKVWQKAA